MPRSVSEQVVVIAGASTGIGRASALAFAARGAKVVCAARSAQALDTLVTQIRTDGGTAVAVPTDVAEPAEVRALAELAEAQFGRIDTWVNAAAVSVWGRVEDITDAEFDRVMRVNFLGQVHGTHAALPALRRAGGGVIIGISSVEGVRAVPLHSPYTASKFALRAFYDCLRMELAQEGAPIAVTTILPASIDTPFFEHRRFHRCGEVRLIQGGHRRRRPCRRDAGADSPMGGLTAADRPGTGRPLRSGRPSGGRPGPCGCRPVGRRCRSVPAGHGRGGDLTGPGPPADQPGEQAVPQHPAGMAAVYLTGTVDRMVDVVHPVVRAIGALRAHAQPPDREDGIRQRR